jgi:hypothetical protein
MLCGYSAPHYISVRDRGKRCGFKIDVSTYTVGCIMVLLRVYVQVIMQIYREGNQLVFNYSCITINSASASVIEQTRVLLGAPKLA